MNEPWGSVLAVRLAEQEVNSARPHSPVIGPPAAKRAGALRAGLAQGLRLLARRVEPGGPRGHGNLAYHAANEGC